MKILKRVIDFCIKSSLLVAFAIFCLVEITVLSNHLRSNQMYSLGIFFGSIFAYNALKYCRFILEKRTISKILLVIIIVSIAAAFAFLYFFFKFINSLKMQLVFALVLVMIYPFIRKFAFLKLFWIALVISYCTAVIPLFFKSKSLLFIVSHFFERFFLVVALLIPFEISDYKIDCFSQQTVPQKFGISFGKKFGYFCLSIHIVLTLFNSTLAIYFVLDLVISILIGLFIYFSHENQNLYFANFWVESMPIVWYFIILQLI